ncbi:V-type ATPase 116kDa subunit family protein [uncultured Rikenella sp.]|uniref:V-type ATP synthase subunit I n=2 Tax=uncultured Rikenella sp. TaxID=368003 RepID=UPI0026147DEC|nr:V-type ATPase 116kDa subunit family protein [uncultured Rikenella sp.]
MIERMTRFNVVLYHGDVESFMERLRELGVADVTLSDWEPSPEQRERMARAERYKNAYMRLGAVKRGRAEKDAEEEKRDVAPFDTVEEAVEALEGATERIAQLETLRMKATAELDGLAMWGEFDPAEIRRLREAEGIALRFFEVPTKQYRTEWEWEYPIQVVAQNLGGMTYFVVAQPVGEAGAATEAIGLGTAAVELRAPEMTFTQKELQIETYLREEAQKQEVIARAALSRDRIWADYVELKNGIAFDEALHAGTEYAEGTVKVVEAWVPTPLKTKLEEFLDGQPVVWAEEEARVEQNPPIKLKNHFFARLFEPIGSLYMLPRYNEIDITPFFAPFFMLFFGMCFGDAGYGVLFILAIVLFWRKIPVRFRDFAWLALFLNIATVFFGLLTGNVFGIELAKVPELVRFKEYFVSNENMFNVAVGLGAAQILFGMILRIFNRWKQNGSFLYGLSTLGWVILFVTGGLALGGILDAPGVVFYVLLGIAGLLIFFFNSPKKNPLVNVGVGLYNSYEMATGVVGDLVSYVRLFAIGLAGAIIAQVFNALSVGLSGNIPVVSWIVMAIILLIGHGLNIFISALGAFVHPVRLTFVEFYKNAGFDGGGRKFVPFKRLDK